MTSVKKHITYILKRGSAVSQLFIARKVPLHIFNYYVDGVHHKAYPTPEGQVLDVIYGVVGISSKTYTLSDFAGLHGCRDSYEAFFDEPPTPIDPIASEGPMITLHLTEDEFTELNTLFLLSVHDNTAGPLEAKMAEADEELSKMRKDLAETRERQDAIKELKERIKKDEEKLAELVAEETKSSPT